MGAPWMDPQAHASCGIGGICQPRGDGAPRKVSIRLVRMALTPEELADIRTRIPQRPSTDIPMPYEDLVRKILAEGTLKSDRTGTGTVSLFGQQMRFDLSEGFPLLTTKTVFFKGIAHSSQICTL